MTFNKEQIAFIEQISWSVGDKIGKRVSETLRSEIAQHALECKNNRLMERLDEQPTVSYKPRRSKRQAMAWFGLGAGLSYGFLELLKAWLSS